MTRWQWLAVSATVLLGSAASAGEGPSYPRLAFQKYVVESNGLEVILYEDHSLPVAAVNVWYHAGPINEDAQRTGFAHLFEHLMFQGSKNVGNDQHFKVLEAAGASSINGTTSYDRTNYFETVPANQLELALWLESDRMGFLLDSLSQEKLDEQREVVKNERRQSIENRPYGPSYEKLIQTLFPAAHPYYGAIIGSMADLSAASLDDVKSFFTHYYAPANATLVIAGDFDPAQARRWVAQYFATLPRRPAPAPRAITTPPITQARRVEVREPVMLPQLTLAWLSAPFFEPDDATADILAFVLGGGKSGRMYRKLVYELELAQSVSVSQRSNALASVFAVTVTGRPGVDIAALEAEVWKILQAATRAPPTQRELTRARNMLVTHSVADLQQIGEVADRLNTYNQYTGNPDHLQGDLERYDSITPQTLQRYAAELLVVDHSVTIITVPEQPSPGDES